jgi:hypothetical protein
MASRSASVEWHAQSVAVETGGASPSTHQIDDPALFQNDVPAVTDLADEVTPITVTRWLSGFLRQAFQMAGQSEIPSASPHHLPAQRRLKRGT